MCTVWILLYILINVSRSYSSFMEGQVRNEALRYLYSVGQRYLHDSNSSSCPLEYMNDPTTGWQATSKLVKAVAMVVCGDYPYDGERGHREIKVGCELFEWITAYYLAFLSDNWAAKNRPLPQYEVQYPNAHYTNKATVTLAKVRDLVPPVCEKLKDPVPAILNFHNTTEIAKARVGCRKLNDVAADYLTILQRQDEGPNLKTYKHCFYNTSSLPGFPVTYDQVSQSVPIVCEGDVSPSMRQSCSFFHTLTGELFANVSQVLRSVGRTSNVDPYDRVLKVEEKPVRKFFPFHRAKPFFIHYCRKTEMSQTEKRTCRYLLTEHVELLVNYREKVLEHSRRSEGWGFINEVKSEEF